MFIIIARRRFKSGATSPTTKGALAIAGTVLAEVASATQSVPYIEAVSSIIAHIVKIHEVCVLANSDRLRAHELRIANLRDGSFRKSRQ